MGTRWRRCVAAAGGVALAAAFSGPMVPITAAAAQAAAPTFGNPTISGVQGTGFEQDLRIDRSGRVYTSAPGSLSSSISYINRSFDGGHHALIAIYPNPLNPEKYVVLNSSFTYREYDYLNNARQVPKLPDYAVIDVTTPPNSRYPGKVVRAGFFDEQWKLQADDGKGKE